MTGDAPKITADHLARAACVYVRQSTPSQVRNNLESKHLQWVWVWCGKRKLLK